MSVEAPGMGTWSGLVITLLTGGLIGRLTAMRGFNDVWATAVVSLGLMMTSRAYCEESMLF